MVRHHLVVIARMHSACPGPGRRYRVAVHRAKGCYFAHVVDIPGCVCRGATEVEAVENARHALRAYLWIAQVLASEAALVEVEICP